MTVSMDTARRTVLDLGEQIIERLQRIAMHLNRACGDARADAWIGIPGVGLFKFLHTYRARKEIRSLDAELEAFKSATAHIPVDREVSASAELPPALVLADVFEIFTGDWLMLDNLEKARRQANIGVTRMRVVMKKI